MFWFIYALTTGAILLKVDVLKMYLVKLRTRCLPSLTTQIVQLAYFWDSAGAVLLQPSTNGTGIIDSIHYSEVIQLSFSAKRRG